MVEEVAPRLVRRWGPTTEEDRDVLLVLALTLGTGVVDAVSYVALDHVFTANMSGNMALLGVGLATDFGDVVGNAFAVVGFCLGAILGSRLLRARPRSVHESLRIGLTVEVALLVVLAAFVGVVDLARDDAARYSVALTLAVAMGLQTGLSRIIAVRDVNTTVATMTLHDFAAESPLAGQPAVRWRRRAAVIVCLIVGGAAGVALDRVVPWGGLALTAVIVFGVLLGTHSVVQRSTAQEPSPQLGRTSQPRADGNA